MSSALLPRACRRSILAAFLLMATALSSRQALAQDAACDGQPSGVRLFISVDKVVRSTGEMTATIYPDDPHRFLAHHGQIAIVRRPSAAPSTGLCLWLPAAGRYEVAVYQDLNGDHRFNRTALGLPAEPYGLSNDPPSLMGLPTFRSVQFAVRTGDNTIHVPLHRTMG